jgi:DNA polymerase-3 subunit alpha
MMGAAAEIPEPEIKTAPAQYTDKEQLLWERELMGLYISAHPLDKYDKYFEEQTMPIAEIKPALNGASVIVGGIITDVRTLITKSGSKMAFVKIEDKSNEIEMVVFPRTFETVGAKLVADTVIKVTGKVNATDRDGNMTDEAKINAEEIDVVTDDELNSYESTGAKLKVPTKGVPQKPRGKTAAQNVNAGNGSGGHGGGRRGGGSSAPATHFATSASGVGGTPIKVKKLYIRVLDPSNKQALVDLKTSCGRFPGMSEVILVIGPDKKAMRLPFRCECDAKLLGELKEIFGEEGVIAK